MENPKKKIVESLQSASNVLVTVSNNPSIDQLAACIGLTLMLNAVGKHATAVFSGEVPSTLEFLKPEQTLEKNTDSLRDFIISLDKAKADKLRYKVEDKLVRIFITPYRTSLSDKDLEFSQGDFNVDAVVALGVHERDQLDQAIQAHGRILHDATMIGLNTSEGGNIGTLNWVDTKVSSLSEMVVSISESFDGLTIDGQMATALLTGIVAETNRFSNDKTSSTTMQLSSKLMAAGANQQLVATKLESDGTVHDEPANNDGNVDIQHDDTPSDASPESASEPAKSDPEPEPALEPDQPAEEPAKLEDDGTAGKLDLRKPDTIKQKVISPLAPDKSDFVSEPPSLGGTLTGSTKDDDAEPSTDPLSQASDTMPLMDHNSSASEPNNPLPELPKISDPPLSPLTAPAPTENKTNPMPPIPPAAPGPADMPPLAPTNESGTPDVGDARSAVEQAMQAAPPPPEPSASINALPIDLQPPAVDPATPPSPSLDTPPPAPAAHDPLAAFDPIAPTNDVPPVPDLPPMPPLPEPSVQPPLPPAPADSDPNQPIPPVPDLPPMPPLPASSSDGNPFTIDPNTGDIHFPENVVPPAAPPESPTTDSTQPPAAPPPVPPPMMPPAA